MKSSEFERWLEKQGCTLQTTKSGHLKVYRGGLGSILPMHGANKEIGKGLEMKIKKNLGLK